MKYSVSRLCFLYRPALQVLFVLLSGIQLFIWVFIENYLVLPCGTLLVILKGSWQKAQSMSKSLGKHKLKSCAVTCVDSIKLISMVPPSLFTPSNHMVIPRPLPPSARGSFLNNPWGGMIVTVLWERLQTNVLPI